MYNIADVNCNLCADVLEWSICEQCMSWSYRHLDRYVVDSCVIVYGYVVTNVWEKCLFTIFGKIEVDY